MPVLIDDEMTKNSYCIRQKKKQKIAPKLFIKYQMEKKYIVVLNA